MISFVFIHFEPQTRFHSHKNPEMSMVQSAGPENSYSFTRNSDFQILKVMWKSYEFLRVCSYETRVHCFACCRFNGDGSWSETGDRYLLKLFRDYLFHQVTPEGAPWIDLAHIVQSLNKVCQGSHERSTYKCFSSVELVFKKKHSIDIICHW